MRTLTRKLKYAGVAALMAVTALTVTVAAEDPPEAEATACFVQGYIYGYNPNYYYSWCTGGQYMMNEQYRSVAKCYFPSSVADRPHIQWKYGTWEPAKSNDGWAPVNNGSRAYCSTWWGLLTSQSYVEHRFNIYL